MVADQLRTLAFLCYLLATSGILIFGIVYLSRSKFMPYHAVAVGKEWDDLGSGFQVLVFAGLKIIGSGAAATALGLGFLLLIPFSRAELWAQWAVPLIGLVASVPSLYVTLLVKARTPAAPPCLLAMSIVGLFVLGLLLSLIAGT